MEITYFKGVLDCGKNENSSTFQLHGRFENYFLSSCFSFPRFIEADKSCCFLYFPGRSSRNVLLCVANKRRNRITLLCSSQLHPKYKSHSLNGLSTKLHVCVVLGECFLTEKHLWIEVKSENCMV